MTEETVKILANYGIPSFLTIYVTWWLLNRGVPLVDKWVQLFINTQAEKYNALEKKDDTLDSELQQVLKDVTIVKHQLGVIKLALSDIEKKQGWEEKKIIEILNGLKFTRKWDDPKPKSPELPKIND